MLSRVAPEHAGSAAGVLGTMQQVGGALGIAVVGVVFYGSLSAGHAVSHTFTAAMIPLAVFCAVAAGLVVPSRSFWPHWSSQVWPRGWADRVAAATAAGVESKVFWPHPLIR